MRAGIPVRSGCRRRQSIDAVADFGCQHGAFRCTEYQSSVLYPIGCDRILLPLETGRVGYKQDPACDHRRLLKRRLLCAAQQTDRYISDKEALWNPASAHGRERTLLPSAESQIAFQDQCSCHGINRIFAFLAVVVMI